MVTNGFAGTLTTNHMTVTKIWHFDEVSPIDVKTKHDSEALDSPTRNILRIGNIVNNARLVGPQAASTAAVLSSTIGDDSSGAKSRWVGQPTDVALLDLLDAFSEDDVRERLGTRLYETPFSSERKWMGVVISGSAGADLAPGPDVAYIKGALEKVLDRCDTYVNAQGQEVPLDQSRKQEATKAADVMAQDGLRVLGFASGSKSGRKGTSGAASPAPSSVSALGDDEHYRGLVFAGLVGMNDPPRKGVEKAIRRLMAGKVKVIMITGDAETTAVAIGKKLGMPITMNSSMGRSVIRGDELDQMSEEELSQAIATTSIFARTSPEHKMKIVRALQARGDVVAMTGDGVNDAPALKKADIGISMGRLGTDVAKEAADMILTDDNFATILNAIEEGKGIFYNIQNFITFQLSTSAAALSLVLLSTFLGFQNPLNAMQILWISTHPNKYHHAPLTHYRHPHGRPPRAVPRRRTRRSSRNVAPAAPPPGPRPNPRPPPARPPIRLHHHAWHPLHLLSRDERRRRSHRPRHHHDIHLLRPLRHVQCADVSLRIQERPRRRDSSFWQQNVQLCRRGESAGAAHGYLFSAAAERFPDRGARVAGHCAFGGGSELCILGG